MGQTLVRIQAPFCPVVFTLWSFPALYKKCWRLSLFKSNSWRVHFEEYTNNAYMCLHYGHSQHFTKNAGDCPCSKVTREGCILRNIPIMLTCVYIMVIPSTLQKNAGDCPCSKVTREGCILRNIPIMLTCVYIMVIPSTLQKMLAIVLVQK